MLNPMNGMVRPKIGEAHLMTTTEIIGRNFLRGPDNDQIEQSQLQFEANYRCSKY